MFNVGLEFQGLHQFFAKHSRLAEQEAAREQGRAYNITKKYQT